jgi:hypothetical protein
MRSIVALAMASLSFTLAPEAHAQPREDRGGRIEWREDVGPALEEAERAGRPVLMYFTADW